MKESYEETLHNVRERELYDLLGIGGGGGRRGGVYYTSAIQEN